MSSTSDRFQTTPEWLHAQTISSSDRSEVSGEVAKLSVKRSFRDLMNVRSLCSSRLRVQTAFLFPLPFSSLKVKVAGEYTMLLPVPSGFTLTSFRVLGMGSCDLRKKVVSDVETVSTQNDSSSSRVSFQRLASWSSWTSKRSKSEASQRSKADLKVNSEGLTCQILLSKGSPRVQPKELPCPL